ncbi:MULTISPECIES: histidine kinase [Streptomyces]|uniref:Oxygen sensor histidine kinase NreB n=2 Tax=Streptomyces TaxID=1883 RepID=A0A2N8PHQ9_STRNR|nr:MULTISPECIES: histidine kinase [Streptomyces]PNE40520.1 histidine kinase [Streptomyces noursei]SHM93262.1 Signal transduction histidine kinase [Streptomyces yunnanensis]
MRTDTQGNGEGHTPEARSRWFGLWDGYFAVSYTVTTVLLFNTAGDPLRRALAIAALTLLIPWYAALGRGLMLHSGADRTAGPRHIAFVAGLFLLFATATACAIAGSFALFTVVPMLMMALPTAPAVATASLANLTPPAVVLLTGGDWRAALPLSLLGIALSVLLGLWISKVVRQSRERGELIAALHRSRDQLATMSRQAGIAAERERLAREIHDTIAQSLTSIITLVQAAESELAHHPDLAARHLALTGRVARESLTEARDFVADRTPPPLRDNSLAHAVRRQADALSEQTGMTVRCTVHGAERPVPMPAAVVLLRSAQESLANVRKHAAGARTVTVTLAYEPHTVRLTVADDGAGFAADRDHAGYGLRGMRTRAEEIGGHATADSRPGQGATITITVPADPGDEDEPAVEL